MVVIWNDPVCVVGMPLNMYCPLLAQVEVRVALRSIFTPVKGSSVARNCQLSFRLLVAGVVTLSAMSSQPLRAARSM